VVLNFSCRFLQSKEIKEADLFFSIVCFYGLC
jgi:hypothetical protein